MKRSVRKRPCYPWFYSRAVKCPVIIVIGMHRSGTGLVSRILQNMGVFMGRDLTGNEESVFFLNLNKEVLDIIGCNWRCLDHLPVVAEFDDRYRWMINFVRSRLEAGLIKFHFGFSATSLIFKERCIWGWKDPRNSLLLPVWLKLFPRARVVHIFRDGRDVALSLLKRDLKRERGNRRMTEEDQHRRYLGYFKLWEDYIIRIRAAVAAYDSVYSLRFEDLLERTESVVIDLAKAVGVNEKNCLKISGLQIDKGRQGRYREAEFSWAEKSTPSSSLLEELGYL
ncbi:MAG: sulfotransferase [Desulfobacterales bacterium]